MVSSFPHQYVDRASGRIVTEKMIGDRAVAFLYNTLRENSPTLFRALTSARMSSLLAFCHYDRPGGHHSRAEDVFSRLGIDWQECLQPPSYYSTMRRIFERQIRYWDLRPMDEDPAVIVSPADARLLIGSFAESSALFIKEKFFDIEELLGCNSPWHTHFHGGDFSVCRLTPDKYHYNHLPVSGRVEAIYEVDGCYHSCNPLAFIAVASLYSKNRRVVTVIDTDVEGGSRVGLVAMVEIVALMIGDIIQAYSEVGYVDPQPVVSGLMVRKGCPKSLYRPGSSTDVLLFQAGRIQFDADLVANSRRHDVSSRFTSNSGRPLVETDIRLRSSLARRRKKQAGQLESEPPPIKRTPKSN
ncbi:MAG: phosphatidylserine decarboxylase [Desulfocapsaceae bacterium]|nr:phosphatidylserine decarboxylase [Desulfocapsaceae bacterium]